MNQRNFVFFTLISLLFLTPGCVSKASQTQDLNNQVILTVNGDKVTVRDVRRELSLRAKQDPGLKVTPSLLNQQLELIVDRRILIQEATKRHLAEEESFVNTIRIFWEQTLIRNLLEKMTAELERTITVSDKEINDTYAKMSQNVTFQIARSTQKNIAQGQLEQLKKGQDISWDEKLGPVAYEEISSRMLEKAFDLSIGQSELYFDNGVYYVVKVLSKEPVSLPAMDTLRKKIESMVKQRKEQAALDSWLKERRSKSKIKLAPSKPTEAKKK